MKFTQTEIETHYHTPHGEVVLQLAQVPRYRFHDDSIPLMVWKATIIWPDGSGFGVPIEFLTLTGARAETMAVIRDGIADHSLEAV